MSFNSTATKSLILNSLLRTVGGEVCLLNRFYCSEIFSSLANSVSQIVVNTDPYWPNMFTSFTVVSPDRGPKVCMKIKLRWSELSVLLRIRR